MRELGTVPSRRFAAFFVAASVLGGSLARSGDTDRGIESLPTLADASVEAVARDVDRLIDQFLADQGVQAATRCSDEDFLRRASLDLAGRVPTPEELASFVQEAGVTKRSAAIEQLISSEGFSQTWAGYWREVIYSRATDVRSLRWQNVFERWMAEQLAADRPWDEIVTMLLTATGDTSEVGSTGLIFAHGGDPTELAAEVSRIFLGIQIQCANCHDHPYDSWKREDFHELAAFFPRIRVRRTMDGEKRTFVVESADNARTGKTPPIDIDLAFKLLDRDQDGRLTAEEVEGRKALGNRIFRMIKLGDADQDGALSRSELEQLAQRPMNQVGRGAAEYLMPDLEDPTAEGTRTVPVSFLDERSVPFGTKDLERRGALAESIVSSNHPWFARAMVNRIWTEMLGQGFYSPVDDMGPERTAELPEVLDTLAAGFLANGYDVRWLYRTIAQTEAYQRAMPQAESIDAPAFAAMAPTRLRGDQIYNALMQVIGVEKLSRRALAASRAVQGSGGDGDFGRALFSALFNYDPSTPQEDLTGSIPQALFMMNSQVTHGAASSRGGSMLARTLREFSDDDDALAAVYRRVLSREPTMEEAAICREHISHVGNRAEAFEDIVWSLLNSSEFLTKR
ncbi:MAG: DUF1549 domain-containing protein [Planctomycetaceae bacterium]|nr:DUF1549 domain-containing protein [Planctomycetaceae bacterium]